MMPPRGRPHSDNPKPNAERQKEHRNRRVTYLPADKPALEEVAAAHQTDAAGLTKSIMDRWVTSGSLPPPPAMSPDRVAIMERLAAALAKASPQQLKRIADRVGAIEAIIG